MFRGKKDSTVSICGLAKRTHDSFENRLSRLFGKKTHLENSFFRSSAEIVAVELQGA
jgi:hypothetical protein